MSISVLLVDDEGTKFFHITQAIQSNNLAHKISLTHSRTAQSAAKQMRVRQYDVLILDLNLPTRDDTSPVSDGGFRLLQTMELTEEIQKPIHIIGLTANGECFEAHKLYFHQHGWPILQYDSSQTGWQTVLFNSLFYISEASLSSDGDKYDFDLAIITALESPELSQVLALPTAWNATQHLGDDTIYHHANWATTPSRPFRVVACSAIQMGMPASTALAMKVIGRYRPRYLAMAGIAAGIRGNYGDILFADQSWDYGSGKSKIAPYIRIPFLSYFTKTSFEPAPSAILVSPYLAARVQSLQRERPDLLRTIQQRWKSSPLPTSELSLKIGPLASGAAVLENPNLVNDVHAHNRKLIGVEMEAYGVFIAARVSSAPRPLAFVAKSICDFADATKSDDWQQYAAFTSANFIYDFVQSQLVNSSLFS